MSFNIGSYKNRRDIADKQSAYRRYLDLQISLNQKEGTAFADKFKRQDTPYILPMSEMPKFNTQDEFLRDLGENTRIAVKNALELIPQISKATDFIRDMFGSQTGSDPLTGEALPLVSIFNNYFDRFKTFIKGIKVVSPTILNRLWVEFVDSLVEDLLPKEKSIKTILAYLTDIRDNTFDATQKARIDALKEQIEQPPRLSENQYNAMIKILMDEDISAEQKIDNLMGVKNKMSRSLSRYSITIPLTEPEFKDTLNKLGKQDLNTLMDNIISEETKLEDVELKIGSTTKKPVDIRNNVKNMMSWLKMVYPTLDNDVKLKITKDLSMSSKFKPPSVGTGIKSKKHTLMGRGVMLQDTEEYTNDFRYYEFGKFKLNAEKLFKGILSIYRLHSNGRPNIKSLQQNIDISDNFKSIIKQFLTDKKINVNLFYKLNDDEKRVMIQLFKTAGFLNALDDVGLAGNGFKYNAGEQDKQLLDRFDLVRGQIIAGQNHKEILDEMVALSQQLCNLGYLTKYRCQRIISEIYLLNH